MSRFVLPRESTFDINGLPQAGATLDFYEVGTTTRKDTFEDEALSTPNANPVVADGNGTFPNIWLNGDYDAVLKDSEGNTVWGPEKVEQFTTENSDKYSPATVSEMVNDPRFSTADIGSNEVVTAEFSTGNGGGGTYDVVLTSSVTPNGRNIIQGVADTTISFVLRLGNEVNFSQLGIFDDAGASDRKADVQAAIDLALAEELPLNGTFGTYRLDSALDKINENFTFFGDQKGAFILLRNYTELDSTRGVLHAEQGTQEWRNIYLNAATGTSGGAGFSLVSTASTSPDFSVLKGVLATGVSGGTWDNAYYFDGQARTGSAPGLRDILAEGDAFASDVELVNATSVNNCRLHINCFAAGGSSSSVKVTGISGNTSNNVQIVCSSIPELKLDWLNNFQLLTSSSMTSITNTANVDIALVIAPFISSVQYFWTNSRYISQNINDFTEAPIRVWTEPSGSTANNLELDYSPSSGIAHIGPQASGNTEMELRTTTSGTYRATHKINSSGSWIFLTTQTAASAANSSLFVDSADSKLKYKDSGGTTNTLY